LLTTDGGTTWRVQRSGTSATLSGIAFTSATHGWVVGDNGAVLATTSSGWGPDTGKPVTYAKPAAGRKYRAMSLSYKISDDLSLQATSIRVVVKNSKGKTVKTFLPATRWTGVWYKVAWTPRAAGTYRVFVYAKDLSGNAQRTAGTAKAIVR
jgi:hypothetical protein